MSAVEAAGQLINIEEVSGILLADRQSFAQEKL